VLEHGCTETLALVVAVDGHSPEQDRRQIGRLVSGNVTGAAARPGRLVDHDPRTAAAGLLVAERSAREPVIERRLATVEPIQPVLAPQQRRAAVDQRVGRSSTDCWESSLTARRRVGCALPGLPRRQGRPPSRGLWRHVGEDLREVLADPADEEHEEMLEWLGLHTAAQFDSARFDVDEVNRALGNGDDGRTAVGRSVDEAGRVAV
jgi:hypothetical protein